MKRELVIGNTGQDGAYLAGFLRRTQTKVDRFRKTNALAAPAASDSSAPSASLFFNTWEAVRRGAAPLPDGSIGSIKKRKAVRNGRLAAAMGWAFAV